MLRRFRLFSRTACSSAQGLIGMGEREHSESSGDGDSSLAPGSVPEDASLPGLAESFIKSAVLGFAFSSILFVVADQTGLAAPLLRWLHLPGTGGHLGAKQLVLLGVLFGVGLNALDRLVCRARRLFGNLRA